MYHSKFVTLSMLIPLPRPEYTTMPLQEELNRSMTALYGYKVQTHYSWFPRHQQSFASVRITSYDESVPKRVKAGASKWDMPLNDIILMCDFDIDPERAEQVAWWVALNPGELRLRSRFNYAEARAEMRQGRENCE